ncbi:MAG: phosphoenolpyruvate carboxylase [Pseudomonadales bacterium]|nr:phosphoenolpyruvate carboxylase [Pseudomonadales bacterium]
MNSDKYSSLRRNVNLLGRILGEVIAEAEGEDLFNNVERIRQLSKSAHDGEQREHHHLQELLDAIDQQQLLPVARAFSQFLNLANIAEQHHAVSREIDSEFSAIGELHSVFGELQQAGVGKQSINEAVEALNIELVLTAHPTEVVRRTLIHKYDAIDNLLGQLELQGRTEREEESIRTRLKELVSQIWYSQEFREKRPTPVDEAKGGFAVVENSLWQAVPKFLRRLDSSLREATGAALPLSAAPVSFTSWMGGDRDGNPNVTATVTREVMLLSRWQAVDLYYRDINSLIEELSMSPCNATLEKMAPGAREPYRVVLRKLRARLKRTLRNLQQQLAGEVPKTTDIVTRIEDIWQPVHACYESLRDCGMQVIANGAILDVLRRIRCFDLHLVRHDIRQEASVHSQFFSELTNHLGLGDYLEWDEAQRQEFLYTELQSRRPLIPSNWQPDAQSQELLDTCKLIAAHPAHAFGAYVISMASQPSDVLAVELLQKECGSTQRLPVAPLFETLDDLANAPEVVTRLLDNSFYRQHIDGHLMVMIGYSDSAKDAGVMAAAWAQYTAQENLLSVCEKFDVKLTLFHGRGGTIGRGGAPAHSALLSQPPGTLRSGLRVTEQGEMIRTKLGQPAMATKTLALYTSAILQANLLEPPQPQAQWRKVMDDLAAKSCEHYRDVVQRHSGFVDYFRQATPEPELSHLPIGSRPARRGNKGGIKSLRAIPWIFAWSQNRLMLPAWLGAAQAMQSEIDAGRGELLRSMRENWPFFDTRLSMLEMVYAKSDVDLSAYYDSRLVDEPLRAIGVHLREQLSADIKTVLSLIDSRELLESQPWAMETIGLRNIYTDPLNVLQVELLHRNRQHEDPLIAEAIMVTIAGIAAGMRNTG